MMGPLVYLQGQKALGVSNGFEKEVEGYVSGSVPYDWEVLPGIKCAGFEVESRCSVQA